MCGCGLFFLWALLALKATGIQFCHQLGASDWRVRLGASANRKLFRLFIRRSRTSGIFNMPLLSQIGFSLARLGSHLRWTKMARWINPLSAVFLCGRD